MNGDAMPSWSDDEGRCYYDVQGVAYYASPIGCPMHGGRLGNSVGRGYLTKETTMRSDDNEVKRTALAHLAAAAGAYAREPAGVNAQALADAAVEWATVKGHGPTQTAKQREVSPRVSGPGSGVVVPFGKNKGQPIEECDAKDLQWLARVIGESIDSPEKQRWRADNIARLEAIEKELATR